MRYQFLLCAAAGLCLFSGPARSEPESALTPLRGNWEVVEYESSGKKIKTAIQSWEITGSRIIRKSTSGATFTYHISLDPTKTPKEIDLETVTTSKPPKTNTMKGIYLLEGDQLKICYTSTSVKGVGKARPTAFMTNAGDGYLLYTLKRVK